MFEGKYKKLLLIGLIVLIVIVLGTLTFFIVDFIRTSNEKKDASDATRFNTTVNIENRSKANTTNEETFSFGLQQENLVSSSTTGDSGKKMYKGFEMAGTMRIPKINVEYPVLAYMSAKSIEVSVAINGGPGLNKPGNTVIVGHNYRNGALLANAKNLVVGDKIYITDNDDYTVEYTVYNTYITGREDSDFYERSTNGAREISLTTCTDDTNTTNNVLVIWAKEN